MKPLAYNVTVGAHSVGASPTYAGMLAIANIFSACGIGHTIHTPSTYAAHVKRTWPDRHTQRELVAASLLVRS